MHDIHVILADLPGLGRVRLCECKSIHITVGPVTLNLEPAAFRQMATLVCSAAERLDEIKESREQRPSVVRMFRPAQSRMTH